MALLVRNGLPEGGRAGQCLAGGWPTVPVCGSLWSVVAELLLTFADFSDGSSEVW